MADLKEYKCPACGGAMEFDSSSQNMKCPYCDTQISVDDYEQMMEEQENAKILKEQTTGKHAQAYAADGWIQANDEIDISEGMAVYICESCGGEIMADKNTGATTCPFCGNRVVFKGKFDDELKPDYVIPFKLNKKAAKEAYYNHVNSKQFVPQIFSEENHIDEIVGVYVPFWIFDMTSEGNASYQAEKVRTWTNGDVEYTEHNLYHIERTGQIDFEHIPEDGSRKMADDLMESIEPFDFSAAVPFKAAYLAGYVADRYDVEVEECLERAKKRVLQSTKDAMANTVVGYSSVRADFEDVKFTKAKHKYALYPVWILNTTWNGEKYVFAMNGQSGKLVGNLPVDKKAFWTYVGIFSVLATIIAYVLMTFIGLF